MGREWKPGDVALIVSPEGDGHVALVRRRIEAVAEVLEFAWANGGFDRVGDLGDGWSAHPLVVIDPEDRTQVEALCLALAAKPLAQNPNRDNVRAALRSLVAPPKPDEPQGLGAVVEDAEGKRFVRYGASLAPWIGCASNPGMDPDGPYRYWSGIDAVRVLSEGVQ